MGFDDDHPMVVPTLFPKEISKRVPVTWLRSIDVENEWKEHDLQIVGKHRFERLVYIRVHKLDYCGKANFIHHPQNHHV